jgi:hypothetical protein
MRREPELLSRYLDGEIPYDQLPGELRAEADRFQRIVAALARPAEQPSSVRAAVMARVRKLRRSPWRRAAGWALTPRTIRLSPMAGGLALAAVLLALVLARPPAPDLALPAAAEAVTTRFVLVAPTASRVAVTGDFVNWDPDGIGMQDRSGNGVWVAEVRLSPGIHQYVFVVDGVEWRPDPNATSQVEDGFGQLNSVLLVPGRASS